MKPLASTRTAVLALSVALVLSACGGGSSGSGTPDPSGTPNTNTNTADMARVQALRAAIGRGSTNVTGSPTAISIHRGVGESQTMINIQTGDSSVRWSDAGVAPVASGTRGFHGFRLARVRGGVGETAWIWTDIEPTLYRPFAEVYTLDYDTDRDDTDDALSVASHHLGLISNIARHPDDMREDDDESVNPVDRGILGQDRQFDQGHMISARFDGAYGIYICISAICTINMDSTRLTEVSGWAFMPRDETGAGDGTRSPRVPVPDADYRYFGLWLRGPDSAADGDFDIRTFAGGTQPYSGDVTVLTGRATYISPAGGKYVKDMGDSGARAGLFTAKVTLHADFGTSPQITGSMQEFRDGSRDLGWRLNFRGTPFTGTKFSGTTFGTTYATRDGQSGFSGSLDNLGRYSGRFYGGDDGEYPNGVAGTFSGRFDDGLVIGGFGGIKTITQP